MYYIIVFAIIFFCFVSKPVLNRCVPKLIKDVTESILSNFYDLLNGWDTLEQILGDLYHTWREILGLAVLSLGKCYWLQFFY